MLKDKVKDIPHKPGVYKYLDKDGAVLYVGKAKDLRSRVAQYFGTGDTRAQLPFLLAEAVDIEYIVVNSELESLFLENTLIKEYMPPYNIKLRDDKNYAFIKIDYSTEIPQITYARKIEENVGVGDAKNAARGNYTDKYFGPYSSTAKIRKTLDFVRRVFPYCANKEVGKRPCFYYYLHRCPGVCIGVISLQDYELQLERIALFLAGRNLEIKKTLAKEMRSAAKWKYFETAARLRDQLKAIEVLDERQAVLFSQKVSWDFVSVFIDPISACVNVFKVREGKLLDKENFIYDNILHVPEENRAAEVMQTFLEMYYATATNLPKEIYLQGEVANEQLIKTLLASRATKKTAAKIKLSMPTRGQKLNLINLGKTNAEEYLRKWQRSQATNIQANQETLSKLQEILNLPTKPRRIEGYDISNTQGTNPVGSMVVIKDGQAAKSEYRKFKITSKQTPDDFLMMREMLTRRLARLSPKNENDKWPLPDLIVIDGGKGQLGVVVEVLEKAGLQIPVVGLAKRIEEIFLPHNSTPIVLEHSNPVLQMLQRLRDEAHRFGITFHRTLRSKQAVKSELDTIPGIGPKTKKLLKQKIGSVQKIKQTPIAELGELVGPAKAKIILQHLK
ncbi:MAG TPA: excinuclease ABC subunit UvrC [Patescibacteria group bacterium]|jgi:excinuclease ABC subunit C|nr:excinuclease ABC subunit UvrC [Patescibacteria group bacterium]